MEIRKVSSSVYNKEYFYSVAEGFQSFHNFFRKINPKFKKALRKANLKKGEKVLDYGCGRGEMIFYADVLYGCDGVGIDYSSDAINICNDVKQKLGEKKKVSATFKLIDSNLLPFKDESFDVIFFLDVWEHLYPEQIDIVLKEFNRVLKNGGRLIVHTAPNKLFFDKGFPRYTFYINKVVNKLFKVIYKRDMARSDRDPHSECEKIAHINEQTRESVTKDLKKFGFDGGGYN